jgi:hypothetical protein
MAVSCEDFLERDPLDQIASSQVFEDEALAQAFLNNVYSGITSPLEYNKFFQTDNCTDNARTKSGWIQSNSTVVPGLISPERDGSIGAWNYGAIRKANEYIEGIATSSLDADFVAQTSAEARFVRAWLYFEIVKRYGAAPLVTKPLSLEDDIYVKRDPASEIWNFIDAELDAIDEVLPHHKDTKDGKASKEACWALGSRAMLYAERYAKSIDYSQRVIKRAEENGDFEMTPGYQEVFMSKGGHSEVIFEILYDGVNKGHEWDALNIPFSYSVEWGSQTNPTQEMVDAYYMANGKPITDPTSGYDENNPYVGRDPRFDATILHHGSEFQGRKMNTSSPNGPDRINGSGLHTITGYYIRKYMNEEHVGPLRGTSSTSWKIFRLGEMYMNCAEAENELNGATELVYKCVNKIRARVGMPPFPADLNQSTMRNELRHERRIEFAFEDQRWWDLIRWRKSVEVLNDRFWHGVVVTINEDESVTYDMTYEVNNRPKQKFEEKHYLQPIPIKEITNNPNIADDQNPGY